MLAISAHELVITDKVGAKLRANSHQKHLFSDGSSRIPFEVRRVSLAGLRLRNLRFIL